MAGASFNQVLLIGRMAHDPELRVTAKGKSYCQFTIATNREVQQDMEPATDYIRLICWARTAETLTKYGKKGMLLHVRGVVHNNRYKDKNGDVKSEMQIAVLQITFLERFGKGAPKSAPESAIDSEFAIAETDELAF